jgi:hypothetical protein
VVYLDTNLSQRHAIVNSVTQENVSFSIKRSDSNTTNETQDDEVTSTCDDDDNETPINTPRMVRRASSFLESPLQPELSKRQSRSHTIHLASSPITQEMEKRVGKYLHCNL